MRTTTVQEIKEELLTLKPAQLISLCIRLARFKKENKELLSYLLFEAHDEEGFITGVKSEMEKLFAEINQSQLYFAKKSLRKIVRIINKYSRYSGNKQTEAELRLFFCDTLKASGIPFRQNAVISNLYDTQLKKATVLIAGLHEDLQHDYNRVMETLKEEEPSVGWSIFRKKKKK